MMPSHTTVEILLGKVVTNCDHRTKLKFSFMAPPAQRKRPIGFVLPDQGNKTK